MPAPSSRPAPPSRPAQPVQPVRPSTPAAGSGDPEGPGGRAPGRRSRENTRARLLEAAATVVSDKGIEGARIDDIVSTAGFTRGAFYSNYASVEEVVHEAIVARCTTLVHQVGRAVAAIEEPPSVDTLMDVLEAIRPEGRTIYVLTTEYRLYRMRHPEAEEIPVARREELFSQLADTVEGLLARMGRRPLLPAQTLVDVLAVFFLDSVAPKSDDITWRGGERGSGHDPRPVLRQVVEAVILGLSTPEDSGQGASPTATADTTPPTP